MKEFLKRRKWWLIATPIVLALLGWGGLEWFLRSDYLKQKITEKVIAEAEQATGGEAELDAVELDPATWTVDVSGLRIRGTDGEVFFEAPDLLLGLSVESLWSGDVRLTSMRFDGPRARIVVAADGTTNLPERPEIEPATEEEMVSLTSRLFEIRDGVVEFNGEPYRLDVRAEGVDMEIERGPECSQIALTAARSEWNWNGRRPVLAESEADVELCTDRLEVRDATLRAAGLTAEVAGTAEPLSAPEFEFSYTVSGPVGELARTFGVDANGRLNAEGTVRSSDQVAAVQGRLTLADAALRDGEFELAGVRVSTRYAGDGRAVRLEALTAELFGGRFEGAASVVEPLASHVIELSGEFNELRLRPLLRAAGAGAALDSGKVEWTAAVSGTLEAAASSLEDLAAQADVRLAGVGAGNALEGGGRILLNGSDGALTLQAMDLRTASTRLRLDGAIRADGRSRIQGELDAQDPSDVEAALTIAGFEPAELPVRFVGPVRIAGDAAGLLTAAGATNTAFEGSIETGALEVYHYRWDSLNADLEADYEGLRISSARLTDGTGLVDLEAQLDWSDGELELEQLPLRGSVRAARLPLAKSLEAAELPALADGTLSAEATISGSIERPDLAVSMTVDDGRLGEERFRSLALQAAAREGVVDIRALRMAGEAGTLAGRGSYVVEERALELGVEGVGWRLENAALFDQWESPPEGGVDFTLTAKGVLARGEDLFSELDADGQVRLAAVEWKGQPLGDWRGSLRSLAETIELELDGAPLGGAAKATASIAYSNADVEGEAAFSEVAPAVALGLIGFDVERVSGTTAGSMKFQGSLLAPESIEAEGALETFDVTVAQVPGLTEGYRLRNPFPMYWAYRAGVLELEHMRLQGEGTNLEVDGDVPIASEERPLTLKAEGDFNLSGLQTFFPDLTASGRSNLDIEIAGEVGDPTVTGEIVIRDGALRSVDFPNGLSDLNGELSFIGRELQIEELTALSGGGELSVTGGGRMEDEGYSFRFVADAERVRVRYPSNLASLIDGRMTLSGDERQSLLSGEILVTRASTNASVSIGDLLAALREPQRTPPKSSLLQNLQFNVHVLSAPDLDIETRLIRDLEAAIDLRLVGTWVSPAVLGRVNIAQGQMNFHGSRYQINRGEIAFVNPFRVEPVLDFEFETRIRNIDIALILSGPARRLNLSYRSDPPLPFADLVNLVALGRTPTFDPVQSSQQRVSQQSLFQTGANNVFSQAIERPVSPGLQRFFGVSRLKVDPQAGGAEANPTARISTEQQITNEVTLTYTYDLSSAQQQTVRLEYAPDREWTFVLTRDENGLVGGDILFRKRLR